jgi:uracil-DNA glycosylase family 4
MSKDLNALIEMGADLEADKYEIELKEDCPFPLPTCFTGKEDEDYIKGLCKLLLMKPMDISINDKDDEIKVRFIPGHRIAGRLGPRPKCSKVMIISKMPWKDELQRNRLMVGESSVILKNTFKKLGMDYDDFYITNILRFVPPVKKLKASWVNICKYFLWQEIKIVEPDFILLLGADAVKGYMPKGTKLSDCRGIESKSESGKIKIWATFNPAAVLKDNTLLEAFENDIGRFCNAVNGIKMKKDDITTDYIIEDEDTDAFELTEDAVISDIDSLNKFVKQMIEEKHTEFAVDAEWSGRSYMTGQLMTIQISCGPGRSRLIQLRTKGLKAVFAPDINACKEPLNRLLCRDGIKIIGHWFCSDLLWLVPFGIDLRNNFYFDTMYAHHAAVNEKGSQSLETMQNKYTNMTRYDMDLNAYISDNNLDKGTGFAELPDNILHPYALKDADVTFRVYRELKKLVDADKDIAKLFYNVIMPGNKPLFEIRQTGMHVNKNTFTKLAISFKSKSDEIIQDIRSDLGNDDFNPNSSLQLRKLFFGPSSEGGLEATPLKSTTGKVWSRVKASEKLNPSADNETMEILMHKYPIMEKIRSYRILGKQMSNILKQEKDGVYTGGIMQFLDPDQRIRSMYSPTTETGRYRSSKPNLQNLANRRQIDIDKIFGKTKVDPIRSIFTATPGRVLVEADFVAAEVVVLATLSGDKKLLNDAVSKPSIHDKTAVDILGANCTYEEVKSKFPAIRIAAKAVNFGIPYQMGPEELSKRINLAGLGCSPEQARIYIKGWYEKYYKAAEYIEDCKKQVYYKPANGTYGRLVTPYGRVRRFIQYEKDMNYKMVEQQREACNFPIQSTVGDTLTAGIAKISTLKEACPEYDFWLCNTVHDAVLIDSSVSAIPDLVDIILPTCLTKLSAIPKFNQQLEVDIKIFLEWGKKPTRDELEELKIPNKYIEMSI